MPLAGIHASHMGFRICRALMSYIGVPVAIGCSQLDYEDCQAVPQARGLLQRHILQRRPCRNQGAIHREMLIE
jgi:hypothetical protein